MVKKNQKQPNEIVNNTPDERVYKGQVGIKMDIFKLSTEKLVKNEGLNDMIHLETYDHQHSFRTFDSSGKKMTRTSAIGGHFHVVTWEDQGTNKPAKILEISPPMREVKRKINGLFKIVVEPVDSKLDDHHTHDVDYMRTENVPMRQISPEAVNIQAAEAQKTAAPAGVFVG